MSCIYRKQIKWAKICLHHWTILEKKSRHVHQFFFSLPLFSMYVPCNPNEKLHPVYTSRLSEQNNLVNWFKQITQQSLKVTEYISPSPRVPQDGGHRCIATRIFSKLDYAGLPSCCPKLLISSSQRGIPVLSPIRNSIFRKMARYL